MGGGFDPLGNSKEERFSSARQNADRQRGFSSNEEGSCNVDRDYSSEGQAFHFRHAVGDDQPSMQVNVDFPSLMDGGNAHELDVPHESLGPEQAWGVGDSALECSKGFVRPEDGTFSGVITQKRRGPVSGVRHFVSRVFKLMEIHHDSQDLSVVEKVILSEENIFSLCNTLSSDSAKLSKGQRMIDFGRLDEVSNKIVGFYGSKEIMMEVFHQFGMSREEDIWSQMTNNRLGAGLYAWLRDDSVFVFYWHYGESLPPASSRGMCCNFVRYIVDLCGTVCVCLDDEKLDEIFFESVQKFSKRKRTQRLQISVVKSSQNSISVWPGFSQISGSLSSVRDSKEFKWTEGSARLALLASFPQKPITSTSKVKERFTRDMFPSTVEAWKGKYRLDLSRLSDADLIAFLEVAQIEQYNEWTELKDIQAKEKKLWTQMKLRVDEMKTEEEEILEKIFNSYVHTCMKLEFPDVMAMNSSHQLSTKTVGDERTLRRGEKQTEGSNIESTVDEGEKVLRQLEVEIFNRLFGGETNLRFVFPGAKCHARWELTKNYFMRDGSKVVFALQHKSTGNSSEPRSYAPFKYGENVVLESCAESGDGELRSQKGKSENLILNDNTVIVRGCFQKKNVLLEFISTNSDGMEKWVRSELQCSRLRNLYRKASFITSVLPYLDAKISPETLLRMLNSEDVMGMLKSVVRKEKVYSKVESTWIELQKCQEVNADDSSVSEDVRKICIDLCERHYENVQWRIPKTAKKFCEPFLDAKLDSKISNEFTAIEDRAKAREREFIRKMKMEFSRSSEHSLKLWIEQCILAKNSVFDYIRDKLIAGNSEMVVVHYAKQEVEAERITWKAFELAPMKDDTDRVHSDPEYVVSPSCSGAKDLIDLDPAIQKLLKVYFVMGGQVLVLVEDVKGSDLHIYLAQKMGTNLSSANPISTMKRGNELLCFDERTRYIAFYDGSISAVKVYRFDDGYRHMDWTGISIQLGEYSVGRLIWMDFVTGRKEIAFIDEQHRLRVCELTQPAMIKPGNVHLGPNPILKAMISAHGSCLLVLRNVRTERCAPENRELLDSGDFEISDGGGAQEKIEAAHVHEEKLMMEVYQLDDTYVHVDSVDLQLLDNPEDYQFAVVCFGPQQHLVYHSRKAPQEVKSKILRIVTVSNSCKIQQIKNPEDVKSSEPSTISPERAGPIVDFIPHIFDKYATSPALSGEHGRPLHFLLVLKCDRKSKSAKQSFGEKCLRYIDSSIERLKKEKGKDFSAMNLRTSVFEVSKGGLVESLSREMALMEINAGWISKMGSWMRRLICLVPIQIARAENNCLQPMVDGLQLPTSVDFVDAISLANLIKFGLYEAVISPWVGPIKVVSSMGKQSSGKSYLLNHLSGSLLDVAGGRCTDGVWMSVRHCKDCLYILLDFEGLGSFERSEQEDMLLSILNAAISNMTIFNKKDFHLDKETEAIFQRFQNGVNLVKADSKLFKGLFYMAIKDVDISDVDDLKEEFLTKITQICNKSQDNFLTKMYGGSVEISAMPFINKAEFYESIKDIGLTLEEIEGSFWSGQTFLRDLKLIVSQITTKDWSSIDSKRVALRINILRQKLDNAIKIGCSMTDSEYQPLLAFDDQTHISDDPLEVEGRTVPVPDNQLELSPFKLSRDIDDVLKHLRNEFQQICPRDGVNDELWHVSLENFISGLVERRKQRVLEWLSKNTADFSSDGDAQKLKLETVAKLSEVQQNLLLCSCKCSKCFLRCVQEKGHASNHSCRGDHQCTKACSYCECEAGNLPHLKANDCGYVAGHDGPHACRGKSHICGKRCGFADVSASCNVSCSKKAGHEGDHGCNSKQHSCGKICSLASCSNQCVHPVDDGQHGESNLHACHEKFCPEQCSMSGCNRTCKVRNHFHSVEPSAFHICGLEHPCPELCEHGGNCEVLTEVNKETTTFQGKRDTFDYVLVSEQNGKRKSCCLPIPPSKTRHDGPHSHSSEASIVHFCETRCSSCGYFCTREIGHGGLHRTTHGNMRDVKFVAESEEIDLQDRKYAWGESGVAELCHLHCKAQGRGHIHLIRCPEHSGEGGVCRKPFDGSRHETCRYGPDKNTPKDELTHTAYWEYMRFEDPCNRDDQEEFELCSHRCKSDEHEPPSGSSGSARQHASYCTEPLWHDSIVRGDLRFGSGYITDDGHHFSCDHTRNVSSNLIFVIDRSASMSSGDIRPSMKKFVENRLGCVYEAITRFIRTRLTSSLEDVVSVVLFHHSAQTIIEMKPLREDIVDLLLSHQADGSTTYTTGLDEASRILSCAARDAVVALKVPTIIFLSDGGNNGGGDPLYHIRQMKVSDPRLVVHTIMFGSNPAHKILLDMASAGDGSFEVSLDEVQLGRRFESLAKSLKSNVVSLM